MLIPQDVAEGIAEGRVTVQFRWWTRPTVKAGGTLRSRVGVLQIEAVDAIQERSITEADAKRAGHTSKQEALARIAKFEKPGRTLYRIQFRPGGVDPRVALRAAADLNDEDVARLDNTLDRMDARSPRGPWTRRTLELIRDHPETRAQDLADLEGQPKLKWKADVRKLKELGLTESLNPGYRLSPRGAAYLSRSKQRARPR